MPGQEREPKERANKTGLEARLVEPQPSSFQLEEEKKKKSNFLFGERLFVLCISGTAASPGTPQPGITYKGSAEMGEGQLQPS